MDTRIRTFIIHIFNNGRFAWTEPSTRNFRMHTIHNVKCLHGAERYVTNMVDACEQCEFIYRKH